MRYLEQNPEVGRVVALKYLGKVLGVAIPLPDPSAPVPYADLSPDDQDRLDEHPEVKEDYMRRELGLDPREPTLEEQAISKIRGQFLDRLVDEISVGPTSSNSGAGEVVSALLEGTSLEEVIAQAAKLLSGLKQGDQPDDETPQPDSGVP